MGSVFNEIQEKFPVRNSPEQKSAFRAWARETASAAGWDAKTETLNKHNNIVIGDPETAKVIMTAHYDTPKTAIFPNLMLPTSKILFLAYQIGVVLVILIPAIAAAFAARDLLQLDMRDPMSPIKMLIPYLAVYLGLFVLGFKTFTNRHNANDNTSGTAAVLETALSLPEDTRNKAAFILFDDEEKGKLGSKAFAKEHAEIKRNTLVLNLDCVGYGDNFLMIYKENCENTAAFETIRSTFLQTPNAAAVNDKTGRANSDQTNFDRGIAVVACKKSKHGVMYVDKIHTNRDTAVNEENIHILRDTALKMIEKL